VESAQADRQRNSATIQVVFSRDPKANGYRLEHGFNPVLQDPDTGLFYPGDFRVAPHPTAKATVVGTANTEHEGRELTVLVATIEELDPGTSTTWRVVTMADGQDRWPTGEFIVSTLPPWQFPWRQAMLVAALIALAAVLYLRWRLHRVPR
jgi:inorganic pyrophosphatase